MFKKIVVGLLAFALSLVLIGLLLPSDYRVERSASIAAPSAVVHRSVADLRSWPEWTAWNAEMDPTLVYNYEGGGEGVGALMRWKGGTAGDGMLKITESDPNAGIRYDLEIDGGRFAVRGRIRYGAEMNGTEVTWSDEGDLGWNPVLRWFGLMMDGMMGKDLEKGLAGLRTRAEAEHTAAAMQPAAGDDDSSAGSMGASGDDDSAPGTAPGGPGGEADAQGAATP